MDPKKIEFSKFGTEIPADLKTEVEIATSRRRVTLKTATEQAFLLWLAEGTVTTPELKQIQSNPKDPRGLPHVPEGVILKSAQRALYSDLVAKLAEIIARGSPKLVGILRLGIEWAHGELRPNRPKAEESSAIAHPPTSPKKHGTGGNHPG